MVARPRRKEAQDPFYDGFTARRYVDDTLNLTRSDTMADENIRITLTPEQKEIVKKATGKTAEAVELGVQELEERIAPMTLL